MALHIHKTIGDHKYLIRAQWVELSESYHIQVRNAESNDGLKHSIEDTDLQTCLNELAKFDITLPERMIKDLVADQQFSAKSETVEHVLEVDGRYRRVVKARF